MIKQKGKRLMRLYYINDIYSTEPNGGSKAKSDFIRVFKRNGINELGLHIPKMNGKVGKILWKIFFPILIFVKCMRMSRGDIVFVQMPMWSVWHCMPLFWGAHYFRSFCVILVVHDIERLRNVYNYSKRKLKMEDKIYDISSSVICHNDNMRDYLQLNGMTGKAIIPLEIFDYIIDDELIPNKENKGRKHILNIAGNLDVNRSPFVYKMMEMEWRCIELRIYGPCLNKKLAKRWEEFYRGVYLPEVIPKHLEDGWGLVWDGDSVDCCDGAIGNYLPYINQHKASLYIAAGLPVIMYEKAGLADFVKRNKIGITVSSLINIEEIIESVDEDEYFEMRRNVDGIRARIVKGEFAEEAICKALKAIKIT